MEGKFSFYTYGAVLELNGVSFAAGQLAADMLNLSREKYLSLFGRMVQIQKFSETYDETGDVEAWWKLNNLMYTIYRALKKYKVFQFLLGVDEEQYFTAGREATGQYGLLPPVEAPQIEDQIEQEVKELAEGFLFLNFVDEAPPPELPFDYSQKALQTPLVTLEMRSALLEHYDVNKEAWGITKRRSRVTDAICWMCVRSTQRSEILSALYYRGWSATIRRATPLACMIFTTASV